MDDCGAPGSLHLSYLPAFVSSAPIIAFVGYGLKAGRVAGVFASLLGETNAAEISLTIDPEKLIISASTKLPSFKIHSTFISVWQACRSAF